ncbi:MAG: tetratricopeptide repeat protein [Planctomycetaceae bacterium]|nr:tetratricopeptide repeat protein [Planctomycetaceae bacterium]
MAVSVLAAALATGGALAQDEGAGGNSSAAPEAGAMQGIDLVGLHRLMQDMGMWEIVEYQQSLLAKQGGVAQDVIAISSLVAKATDMDQPFSQDQRLAWLNDAVVRQLRVVEAAKTAAKPNNLKSQMTYCSEQFKLAMISGLNRVQTPYGLNMIFLRGTDEDRRMIVVLTRNAAPLIVDLQDQLRDMINNCTTLEDNLEKGKIEELRNEVLRMGMWILLYRGLALPENSPERALYLTKAQAAGSQCAKSGIDMYRGLLVEGTAAGALGQTDRAIKLLRQVDDNDAPAAPRIQALFEIPRVLAQGGKYTDAMTAVDDFFKKSVILARQNARVEDAAAIEVQQDVSAVILRSYIWDAAAAKGGDAAKSAEYRRQALDVLVQFINKYSGRTDVQEVLYEVIVRKYASNIKLDDPETLKKANPVVLMALAMGNYRSWGDDKLPEAHRLQLLAGPEKALKELLTRKDDAAAKQMRPQALWYLAKIDLVKHETLAAARSYVEIAVQNAAHGLAPSAAFNGVICYSGLVGELQEKKRSISPDLRREYVKALETLLEKPEWVQAAQKAAAAGGQDPNIVLTHYLELGVELQRLVEATPDTAEMLNEKIALRARAAAAFRKVPPADHAAYMEAQYWALDLEAENIDALKESTTPPTDKQVRDLVFQAGQYSEKAAAEASKPSAGTLAKMLREWGARADYLVITLTYNHLGNTTKALEDDKKLPTKWPGTTIIEASMEFRIRKLIETAQIEAALEALNEFLKAYPDRGGPLIDLLITNIQKTIKQLDQGARGPTTEARLKAYREGYAKFAKMLYETKDNADAQTLLDRKQLYGDALIQAARFADARTIFEEVSAAQNADRKAKEAAIAAKFDARQQGLVQVRENPAQVYDLLKKTVDELPPEFVRSSFVARDLKNVTGELGKALGKVNSTSQSRPDTQNVARLVDMCLRGHQQLMARLADEEKEGIAFDAKTFWGMGRSYEGLKMFDKALTIYQRLTQGFDKARQAGQYWESELAYCRCWLETFRPDPGRADLASLSNADREKKLADYRGKIENLSVYVSNLEAADKTFGGIYAGFNAIKADLRQILNR